MVDKHMWNWMDKVEGKKEGESLSHLKKEKERQGYKEKKESKKHEIKEGMAKKMKK